MGSGTMTAGNMLRLVGIMAIGIGAAWALQVLGLSSEGTAFSRLMWVVAAASMAGAGAGLMLAGRSFDSGEARTVKA